MTDGTRPIGWCKSLLGNVDAAKVEVARAKTELDVLLGTEALYNEFTSSTAYTGLMQMINEVSDRLNTTSRHIEALVNQGVVGFIAEVQETEDQKVAEKQRRLDLLLDNNSKEQKAIRDAQADLDANQPGILVTIQRNDNDIAKLKEDNEGKVAWQNYQTAKTKYDKLANTVHALEHTLNTMKDEFDKGIMVAKDKVAMWRDFAPHITRIEVQASTDALKEQKPILVCVTAVHKGITKTYTVGWTPNSKFKPFDLYKAIGDSAKQNFPPPAVPKEQHNEATQLDRYGQDESN